MIKTPDIGDKQVTERKLADRSVTSSKLSTEIANMLSLLTTRISAFKVADNLSSLPTEENTIGWLVDNHLYVYVGNGSTPESGMYQDCGELRGPQGIQGEQGLSGLNGKSAYDIWTEQPGNEDKSVIDFLEFTRGSKGDKGDQGERGYDISNIEQLVKSTEDGGKNIIRVTRSDGWSKVFEILNGSKGSKGDKGTSIVKLEQTRKTTESSGLNTIEATLDDGTKESFEIYNGAKGEQGDKGEKGDKGDQGEIGPQGNSGVADASNKTLVNDAITGGETDFLSAEVGKLGILTYDCSKGGSVTHATLQDAINSVPTTFHKVGLTITYKSGDTIYRYTLKANVWSADPTNWFSVEDKLSDLSIKPFVYSSVNDISRLSWTNGKFVSLEGKVDKSNDYCYSSPLQVKKSMIISFHANMNGFISLISKCEEDGSDISPLVLLNVGDSSDRNIDYVVTEDCYVILCSTIEKRDQFIISSNNVLNTLSVRNNDKLFWGKNVSFLGDSITSYKKYSKCELGGYPDSTVHTSESMWWNLLSQTIGANIDTVNAVSGASITRNSDRVCLLDRCEDLGNPDIIFIAAGTNDIYVNVDIGEDSFSKAKEELSETEFFDAYDLLYRKTHDKYPDAEIILIIPAHCSMEDAHTNRDGQDYNKYAIQGNNGLFREVIYKVAQFYNLRIVDLSRVNLYIPKKDILHPNFQGMQMMANYIRTSLYTNLDECSRFIGKLSYDEQINSFFKEIYYNGKKDLHINTIARSYILGVPYWLIEIKIGEYVVSPVYTKAPYEEPTIVEYASSDGLEQVMFLVDWAALREGYYYRYIKGIKISDSCKDINNSPSIKAMLNSRVLNDNHIQGNPIKDAGWNNIIKEIYYTGSETDKLVLVSLKNNVITANIDNVLVTTFIQDGIAELYRSADKRLIIAVDTNNVTSTSEYSKIVNITGKEALFELRYSPTISAFLQNIIPTENLEEFYAKGRKTAFFDKNGAFNFEFGEKIKNIEDGANISLSTNQETTQRYIAVWAPFVGFTEDNVAKYVMAVGASEDGKYFEEITRFDIASLNNPKWKWLRDPSIIRYNGVFYVAIGANEGNDSYFGILKSEDLKNWSLLKNIKCSYNGKLLKPTAPEIFMVDEKPYVVFQGSFAHALVCPKCYMVELNEETFSTSSAEQTLDSHYIDIGESTAIDYSVIKADNGKYILGMARDWIQTFYESNELFGEYKYLGEAHFGRLTEGTNIVRIGNGVYRIYITTNNDGTYYGFLETRDFKHFYGPTAITNSRGSIEYRHGTVLPLKVKHLDTNKILNEIL